MRAVVDCHMVAQTRAGDAGNARYASTLVAALAATAGTCDGVAALLAHDGAERRIDRRAGRERVPTQNALRLAWSAPRALARTGADAAVFTYVAPPRPPCPVALAVHDAAFVLFPGWFTDRDRRMLRTFVPTSARRAATVLALSRTAKSDLVAALGLHPERVRIVSPAPAECFAPAAGAAERVRERFGLDRYCLAVGDVHPRKNLGALADALALLGALAPELAIVGRPGPRGHQIIALIARAGGRWLGPVDDAGLADLYRAAAVTAYPSRYEGFGLPVVEAMACGSPVVASARGAVPEVAGDAAILVEPEPPALAEGLRAALEPRTAARLAAAGPVRAAAFTLDGMGRAAWAALHEAAGLGRAGDG